MAKAIEEILIHKFSNKGFVEKERAESIENLINSDGLFHRTRLIILSSIKIPKKNARKIKTVFNIKPLLIKFLLVLGFNLSCIFTKLYLNSKNKT